ncbi:MAG: DNA repair protein RecN [Deltaproteobacteria bacterium]|nr:DNA repair protein RecN [Deltaproteobacteria bacterium]
MLTDLQIKNFAIIDDLHIPFSPGLTILSGETGAGKSIIVGALNLILGGRAAGDLIRTGETEAIVEAVLDISGDASFQQKLVEKDLAKEKNATILLKRTISREGKNKILINGNLVTLGMLTDLTESLLTITGQHEHQELLRPQNHIDVLDTYGGLMPVRNEYQRHFRALQQLKQEIEAIQAQKTREAERLELILFQKREIEDAHLVPGEEEELTSKKTILQNATKLITTAHMLYEAIYAGDSAIISLLSKNTKDLKELTDIDVQVAPYVETLESVIVQLEDLSGALRDYSRKIHFAPQEIEQIESRLDLLHRLKRKYGKTVEGIVEYHKTIAVEREQISQRSDHLADLKEQYEQVSNKAALLAQELSRQRRKTAENLQSAMEKELQSLGMPDIRFSTAIKQSQTGTLDEKGLDQAEFLLSPNPGEALRPLARIASGGELSRVMLAFKNLFARQEEVSLLVFDEVDSGIGGATADSVGQRLYEISKFYQIICITHLPQIACYGDNHYLITKTIEDGRTKAKVMLLDFECRVEEIARMLGGTAITPKTRTLAREMVTGSRKINRNS